MRCSPSGRSHAPPGLATTCPSRPPSPSRLDYACPANRPSRAAPHPAVLTRPSLSSHAHLVLPGHPGQPRRPHQPRLAALARSSQAPTPALLRVSKPSTPVLAAAPPSPASPAAPTALAMPSLAKPSFLANAARRRLPGLVFPCVAVTCRPGQSVRARPRPPSLAAPHAPSWPEHGAPATTAGPRVASTFHANHRRPAAPLIDDHATPT